MKRKKHTYQIIFLGIIIAVIASLFSVVAAASAEYTPVSNVNVSINNETSHSEDKNTGDITVTAKGSNGLFGWLGSARTTTIKVSYGGSGSSKVSFDWEATNVYQLVIDGNTQNAINGSCEKVLSGSSTIDITITTEKNANENKLVIKNFSIETANTNSKLTVTYDEDLGSVKVDNTAVVSGYTTNDVAAWGLVSLEATIQDGATFLGWVNVSTGKVLSREAKCSWVSVQTESIKAVFVDENSPPHFLIDGKYIEDDLNEAVTRGSIVVLLNTATLPADSYTIPENVTLQIPYNAGHTLCTTKPAKSITTGSSLGFVTSSANAWSKPTAYCKLTMAPGANITVNGAISLSGVQCSAQGNNGMPTGATSMIDMKEGSSITIKEDAFLYAWGYIIGDGSVEVESGGVVYEDFQLRDWRGGTAASTVIGGVNTYKVFPVTQYFVQNIEVPMTMYSGSEEYAHFSFVAQSSYFEATVPFIGSSGMFQITNGYLIKEYLESVDRLQIDIHGDLKMSALNMSVSSYNMNSADYVLPITNNLRVNVQSGTTTISQDMAFLPGSEVFIMEGAKVQLATRTVNNKPYQTNIYVYDLDQWSEQSYVYSQCDFAQLKYVASKDGAPVTRTLTDAKIVVNGTFDTSAGHLYTTSGGSNICSEGNGVVIVAETTATTTFQYVQHTGAWSSIAANPAWLKNADGSMVDYVKTGSHGADTYVYVNGYWHLDSCSGNFFTETTATCTEAGQDITKCDCYGHDDIECDCHYKVVEKAALGHKSSDWSAPVEGYELCTCTVCKVELAKRLYSALDLEYRLNDYIWMNATVQIDAAGEVKLDNNYNDSISLVSGNDGTYYLVRKVLSTDLTSTFKVTLSIGEIKTVELDLSFTTFANELIAKNDEHVPLVQAMINYGKAADKYFDPESATNITLSAAPSDFYNSFKEQTITTAYGTLNSFNDIVMHTTGATFSFNERLSMLVRINAAGLTEADVAQIGLLVSDSNAELRANGADGVTAYILYDPDYKKPSSTNPNAPDKSGYTEDWSNLVSFSELDLSQMIISFDLESVVYQSRFNIRPYIVTTDGTVIYGEQYCYGLGDYIYRNYNKGYGADFQNFLYYTWVYADKALEAFS